MVNIVSLIAESSVQASIVQPTISQFWDGNKYFGGFGVTALYDLDYWTLRRRSAQLFRDNIYARGVVRRLVTNTITTGLKLECIPDEGILGYDQDGLSDWTETQENSFNLWATSPSLCDFYNEREFAELQQQAKEEAYITGDILVTLFQDPRTKLPKIRLISGNDVQTPFEKKPRAGHEIVHGVELDAQKRQVAYWVVQKDGTYKRIPARGEKSGRRIAWLFYATPRRVGEVRGEPLLSIVLQSLREIDRNRDAAQRKSLMNANLVGFIKKTDKGFGTKPMTNGAVGMRSFITQDDSTGTSTYEGRSFIPGMYFENLNYGEEPVIHPTSGTDINFGKFEEAIIQAIAWCYEIPPNILRLAFSSNYSASGGEINEFKMFLNKDRTTVGANLLKPIYVEWFISAALTRKTVVPGFLESWRNPAQYDIFAAWTASDWSGAIKPSLDILKQANGYIKMVDNGWITNARASRELTGTKFSKNIEQIKRENEQKAAAAKPMLEQEKEFGTQDRATALRVVDEAVQGLQDATDELQQGAVL